MSDLEYPSEIRASIIQALLDKARKKSYESYLASMRLERIRFFNGAEIRFDFPVTALIGPNGSGKSTVLGACACIYANVNPEGFFRKSRIGDDSMHSWRIEYDLVDRELNPKGIVRAHAEFTENRWQKTDNVQRGVRFFNIVRTVPALENPKFLFSRKLSASTKLSPNQNVVLQMQNVEGIEHIKQEAQKILGKELSHFELIEIGTVSTFKTKKHPKMIVESRQELENGRTLTIRRPWQPGDPERTPKPKKSSPRTQKMYIGSDGEYTYSEFNFGSGEASVIRMVGDIEELPNASLVLIEEIENGLHPLAVRRLVEYLIDVARRKNIQVVFTTHSDYALAPLPSEAIWATFDGRLQQGKLSIEVLRAVSGRIDRRLAIFVEDDFSRYWVEAILRERLGETLQEIGIYPVHGDGNAVRTHLGHMSNPAVTFNSLCFVDGDSEQAVDVDRRIFHLPGEVPELTVFNSVFEKLDENIALLTVACQRPPDKQDEVMKAIRTVSRTNRDPHLLFDQIGLKVGFVPGATIRGAFLTTWIQENPDTADEIAGIVEEALEMPRNNADS